MIVDARSIPDGTVLQSTVCIAGAGAAGLTLAAHLTDRNVPVCLVESGDIGFDRATQELASGNGIGIPYDPEATRFRFFGGSTNAWGGLVRPISAHCFERRDWIGSDGWPFSRRCLDLYFDRAAAFLGISKTQFSPTSRARHIAGGQNAQLHLDSDRIETRITARARRGVFKEILESRLRGAPGFRLVLNANVVHIDTPEMPGAVRTFTIRTLCGKTLKCRANVFVLASGGIENARLLLLSREPQADGLGNAHDLVGRYFMDHARINCGRVYPRGHNHRYDFYNQSHRFRHAPAIASLSVSSDIQRKEELLDQRLYLTPVFQGQDCAGFEELTWLRWKTRATRQFHLKGTDVGQIARDLPSLVPAAIGHVFRPKALLKHYAVTHIVEPAPRADSRVMLCHEKDALGCNRVIVDWRLGEAEQRTILRAQEILADAITARRAGTAAIEPGPAGAGTPAVKGAWHHMGTTRMDPNPKRGVVDADCRLHGTGNLFIAGSSVFPTAGDDVPTFTITALAIRLADHIAEKLTEL